MSSNPILELLAKGRRLKQAKHEAEYTAGKLGNFRGGDSGILTPDGKVFGKCQRLAVLKSQGVLVPIERSKFDMFDAGFANEDIVCALVGPAWDGALVTGDATAMEWTLADGTTVSIRPDVVLNSPDGKPAIGLELKSVQSIWTALAVHYDLKPKSDNLIQAAHYSWQLGTHIPYYLVYSSRPEWHISTAPKFLQDKFDSNTYDIECKDNGQPLKITPFNRVYTLTWDSEGYLNYYTEGLDAPVKTVIDAESVVRYYESLTKLRENPSVSPRPSTKTVYGTKGFNACDYCKLADVCDAYEGTDQWRDRVIERVNELKQDPKFDLGDNDE